MATLSTEKLVQQCRCHFEAIGSRIQDLLRMRTDPKERELGQCLAGFAMACSRDVLRKYEHHLNILGPSYSLGDDTSHTALTKLLAVLQQSELSLLNDPSYKSNPVLTYHTTWINILTTIRQHIWGVLDEQFRRLSRVVPQVHAAPKTLSAPQTQTGARPQAQFGARNQPAQQTTPGAPFSNAAKAKAPKRVKFVHEEDDEDEDSEEEEDEEEEEEEEEDEEEDGKVEDKDDGSPDMPLTVWKPAPQTAGVIQNAEVAIYSPSSPQTIVKHIHHYYDRPRDYDRGRDYDRYSEYESYHESRRHRRHSRHRSRRRRSSERSRSRPPWLAVNALGMHMSIGRAKNR